MALVFQYGSNATRARLAGPTVGAPALYANRKFRMRHALLALMVIAVLGGALTVAVAAERPAAHELPRAKSPADVGMSAERLNRLTAAMKAGVDKGEIPGAVVMIVRRGKVAYLEAFGYRDREQKARCARTRSSASRP